MLQLKTRLPIKPAYRGLLQDGGSNCYTIETFIVNYSILEMAFHFLLGSLINH